jgi:hypothetical protein
MECKQLEGEWKFENARIGKVIKHEKNEEVQASFVNKVGKEDELGEMIKSLKVWLEKQRQITKERDSGAMHRAIEAGR